MQKYCIANTFLIPRTLYLRLIQLFDYPLQDNTNIYMLQIFNLILG